MKMTCSDISVAITTRNDSAFSRKAAFIACGSLYPQRVNASRINAKIVGPSTRATLN